jgi:creatinine amidohydrolase
MSHLFGDQRWPQLQAAIDSGALVILPIGQMEEHGRHLPVSTDATIAGAVGLRLAERLAADGIQALVLPAIWTGYSTKDMVRWPGTMRVRPQVFMDLIFDVCGSLIEMGFRKLMLLNCHGHHTGALRVVTRQIADAHDVYMAVVSPGSLAAERFQEIRRSSRGGSIHAGEYETSLMLHLGQPVEMSEATDRDAMQYHSEFVAGDNFSGGQKVFWSTWGLQKSETGAYGDPTVATAETGREMIKAMVEKTAAFAREFMST